MSKLIHASICVSDITKQVTKYHTNGKKYLSVDIWINDEEDKFGNNVSLNISQSKEDREAKTRKTYIGNGKTKFGFDESSKPAPIPTSTVNDDDDDSIPF
jgi:hypothetical protein